MSEQSAGVWVKARERLPKSNGICKVKTVYSNEEETREFLGGVFFNYDAYRVEYWFEPHHSPHPSQKYALFLSVERKKLWRGRRS